MRNWINIHIIFVLGIFSFPHNHFAQPFFVPDTLALKKTDSVGFAFERRSEYDSALFYYLVGRAAWVKAGRKDKMSLYFLKTGRVKLATGNVNGAIQDYFKSLQFATESGDQNRQMMALTRIGRCYEDLGNDNAALQNYTQAYAKGATATDRVQLVYICNSIASVYLKKKKSDSALKYLDMGFEIAKITGNSNALYAINNGYGLFYSENGKPRRAIVFFNEALKLIHRTFPGSDFEAGVYINLGAVYSATNEFAKSKALLEKALVVSKKNHHLQNVSEIYENLSELYAKQNEFQKAFDFLSQYGALQDSMVTVANNKKIAEMQAKFDVRQKEREIASGRALNFFNRKLLLAKKKQFTRGLLLCAILFFLLLAILWAWIKTRKVNAVLAKQKLKIEEQQERIRHQYFQLSKFEVQMNPHFIFNSLNGVQHLVVSNRANELARRLHLLEKLMGNHFKSTAEKEQALENEILFLENYLELEKLRFSNQFNYNFSIDEKLNAAEVSIPPMMLQPVLENCINHGLLPREGEGKIDVRFEYKFDNGQECLVCSITDDGIGRKAAAERAAKNKPGHQSKAIEITRKRIGLTWQQNGKSYPEPFKIIDLVDSCGKALGTQVVLFFPLRIVKTTKKQVCHLF